jgi:hypothetical protein
MENSPFIDGLPINSMVIFYSSELNYGKSPCLMGKLTIKNGDFPWRSVSDNQMVRTLVLIGSIPMLSSVGNMSQSNSCPMQWRRRITKGIPINWILIEIQT